MSRKFRSRRDTAYRGATDHFQIADLASWLDIILNPIGEKCVRLILTQVLQRKYRDALLKFAVRCGSKLAAARLNPERSPNRSHRRDCA